MNSQTASNSTNLTVKQICLSRCEDSMGSISDPWTVTESWQDAEKILRDWAKAYPNDSSLYLCDVVFLLSNGERCRIALKLGYAHRFGTPIQTLVNITWLSPYL